MDARSEEVKLDMGLDRCIVGEPKNTEDCKPNSFLPPNDLSKHMIDLSHAQVWRSDLLIVECNELREALKRGSFVTLPRTEEQEVHNGSQIHTHLHAQRSNTEPGTRKNLKKCFLAHQMLFVFLCELLWWTVSLFRVSPASCLMSGGCGKRMDGLTDGWQQPLPCH